MRHLAVLLAFASLATPALADDYAIKIENNASQAVSSVTVYPVNEAGEPVEDVLGSLFEPIAAGTSGDMPVYGLCGQVLIRVLMADEDELRATIDSCSQRTIVVSD